MSKDKTQEELLYEAMSDSPMLWGKIFFQHHFRLKSPAFHFELINEACHNQFLAVAAPRESAKSTMLVFLYPFHRIIFRKVRFVLLVSNTFSKGAMMLEGIKKEIRENAKLKAAFPGITITKDAEGDSIITHADGFDTRFICKGVDQIGSVRGVKHGAYRPDLILGDDMEDDELVKNPERRLDLERKFEEALVPAGERGNCQYVMVGTIMHDDSLLAKLVSEDRFVEYTKLFYQADMDGTSLWSEKWTSEDLERIKREKPLVYAKEYQNDPAQGGEARFRIEDFRYWRREGDKYLLLSTHGEVVAAGMLSDCKAAISCDLAWSEKRTADNSVIMPGFLTPNNDILIDNYIARKGMRPHEIAEILFQMEERLRKVTGQTIPIGFEKAMLEKVTKFILKQEMKQRNHYLYTKDLKWDTDKIGRIETRLQPRYAQHSVFHLRDMGELEHELLRFPSGIHDDIIDCEQGLVQLLQYPRTPKKETESEDAFMWWRKQATRYRSTPPKRIGQYSSKLRQIKLPATTSFPGG